MTDALQTLKYKDKKLEIFQDEQPDSPREWDNLGTMICSHDRYELGDVQIKTDFDTYLESEGIKKEDIVVTLPLFLIDHSGISMRTRNFTDCDPQQWDSGQVGVIFVTKEKVQKEYSVTEITKETIEKATTILQGEVETYDQYLRGDIYYFVLNKITKCNLDGEHEEFIDSCHGFYGHEPTKNGMDEHIEDFEKFKEEIE